MTESHQDRCRRICGAEDRTCFIDKGNQLTCLADMLVNSVLSISATIDFARSAETPAEAEELLDESVQTANELINWVKFLQLSHDLREVARISYYGVSDARRERRYPLPGIYREYIVIGVDAECGSGTAEILNFSQSGFQMRCCKGIPIDTAIDCTLRCSHIIQKELGFRAVVKYCQEADGAYVVGAKVTEVSHRQDFNFFINVFEFIREIELANGSSTGAE